MDIDDKDQPNTSQEEEGEEEEVEQQTGGVAFSPVGMALSMMEGIPIASTTVVHSMLPDIHGIHHYHRPPILPPDISHQDIVTPGPPPFLMSRRRPIYSLMTPRFAALTHDTQQRAMSQMMRRIGPHHQSMIARNMAYMQMRRDIGNYSTLPGQKKKITEVVEQPEGMKDDEDEDEDDESQWVSDPEDEEAIKTKRKCREKNLSLLLRLKALVKEGCNTPPTLAGEGGKVGKTGIRRKEKKVGLATAYSKYTGKEAQNKMVVSEMGQGDTDKILGLIRDGTSVNVKDNVGRTPLHVACASGNVEGVRLLIHMGAEVNAVDNIGNTPLTIAATRASMEAIVPLLEGGADPRLGRGLMSAIGMVKSRLRMLRIQIRHSRSMEQVAAHSIVDILPQIQERRRKTVAVAQQCMDIIRLLQAYTQKHIEAENDAMSTIYEPPSQSTTILSDQASQELDSLSEQLLTMGLEGKKKPTDDGEEEESKSKGKMPENNDDNVEAEEDQMDQLLERFSQLLGDDDEKATS